MKRYSFISDMPSSRGNRMYTIKMDERGTLTCNCPSWINNTRGRTIRTCKHTDRIAESGFLEGKAKLLMANGYEKSLVVCKNYPDTCHECDVRFRCYTDKNPEFTMTELKESGVV